MGYADNIAQRLAAVRELPGSAQSTRPPLPKSAKIELTSRCDLGCFFCASHQRPAPLIGHGLDAVYPCSRGSFARPASSSSGSSISANLFCVTGCRRRFATRSAYAIFLYVFLTTNGVAATRDRVQACMAAGLDSLKFALNWANARQFERVTAGERRATSNESSRT